MRYQLVRRIVLVLFKVFLFARFVGQKNIPQKGGVLFCSNHKSNFDPMFVACAVTRKVGFMAKEELFKVPVLGSFIGSLGSFPIKRGATDSVAIKKALELLGSGGAMLIFPQGTRKREIRREDFKRGAAMLATRSDVCIVPVAISGEYKLFARPTIRFAEPINVAQYTTNGQKEGFEIIGDLLYNKIKEMSEL